MLSHISVFKLQLCYLKIRTFSFYCFIIFNLYFFSSDKQLGDGGFGEVYIAKYKGKVSVL